MGRLLGWLFLCCISLVTASAQNRELDSLSRTFYVERFLNRFFIWPVVKQRNTAFSLESADKSQKLTFRPNVKYHAGIGLYVFGVGMQLVFALPASPASEQIYGHSSAFDLQGNVIGKHWGVDLFTQHYQGYYLEDNNNPLGADTPRPQRRDIRTWNNGFTGIYFFNKGRYSMRSTYNYYERQLRSAGSIIASVNVNAFSLRADSAIYDSSIESAIGARSDIQRLDNTTFSAAPGYAYTWVLKKSVLVGCALAYCPSLNWLRYDVGSSPSRSTVQLNTFVDLRLSAGYNSKLFFAGISYIYQTRNVGLEGATFSSSNDAVKFAVGYRFKEVGILKRRAFDIFRPKASW
jgi:hypothetical protein